MYERLAPEPGRARKAESIRSSRDRPRSLAASPGGRRNLPPPRQPLRGLPLDTGVGCGAGAHRQTTRSLRLREHGLGDPLILAWWSSPAECASAVARLERSGALTLNAAGAALTRLDALAASWQEVLPVEPIRDLAQRLLRVHDLRAADSLQLAAALTASEQNPGSLELVCLDTRLAAAARREGLRLAPGLA